MMIVRNSSPLEKQRRHTQPLSEFTRGVLQLQVNDSLCIPADEMTKGNLFSRLQTARKLAPTRKFEYRTYPDGSGRVRREA